MTKTALSLALPLFLTFALPGVAAADNCARLAQEKAAELGAQVLSAKTEGGACVVTLRIPGQGGQPPRVETIRLNG